jgi:hypothetical protein
MTDSPRRDGADPAQSHGNGHPRHHDPAYADQTPYGSPYQRPTGQQPTERLPPYQQYGYDPYAAGQYGPDYGPGYTQGDPDQAPPGGGKSPLWLWILAAAVVLLVIALVIALVLANSSRQQTVVAPAPSGPQATLEPTAPTTSPTRSSTPSRTSTPVAPPPTSPSAGTPTESTGATETVDYNVSGEGRVINITYTDTGGVPQTEFNVVLPWSKQVELPSPAESAARISIINVGRDVTCSVAIDGVKVEQSTGSGLTYCVGTG